MTSAADDLTLLTELMTVDAATTAARGERSIGIDVEAFEPKCSRSLIPRYTGVQVRERTQPYIDRINELQERNAELQQRNRRTTGSTRATGSKP